MKLRAARLLLVVPLVIACLSYELELDGLALDAEQPAIFVGDTLRTSLTRRDGTTPSENEVAWSSSHEEVATVDEVGLVTGTGAGWVQVTARTAEFTVTLVLRVWTPAPPFTSIEAGVSHTCALTEDGRAWCWGLNEYGQLGTGAPDACVFAGEYRIPCASGAVPVATDQRFTILAVGYYHSCGLTDAGAVWCWGLNDRGQLGDGSTTTRATPGAVAGEHRFRALAAAGRRTCGIDHEGALLC